MSTSARKRTRSSQPRRKQRSLFDSNVPKLLRKWRQPKIDRANDPNWIFAFVDPAQLGVEVEIPEWLERRRTLARMDGRNTQ
jgi:hypothetical protein